MIKLEFNFHTWAYKIKKRVDSADEWYTDGH